MFYHIRLSLLEFKVILLLIIPFGNIYPQSYNIYFGDLHSHTSYSDGQGTPSLAFNYARAYGDADFLAVTDHSWFGNLEWDSTRFAAQNATTADFLAIRGFELTTTWGHMNVYNTDWYSYVTDIRSFYSMLSADKQCIAQWNHPLEYSDEFDNFSYYSQDMDNVIHLIEIINQKRNMKFESSYSRALDKGWHVSPTANSDMHGTQWITGYDVRTAILATGLTRDELFFAIRNHRTYATEDRNLQIHYSINGSIMGSILSNPEECNAEIHIEDPNTFDSRDKIRLVEIISNKGCIAASMLFNSHSVKWNIVLGKPDSSNTYYYVRVTNADGKIAVTAPVWLEIQAEQMLKTPVINRIQAVYDISGRLLKTQPGSNSTKLSGDFSSGIYILNYTHKDGNIQNKYSRIVQ